MDVSNDFFASVHVATNKFTNITIKQLNHVRQDYIHKRYTDQSKRYVHVYLFVLKSCKYADLKEPRVSQFHIANPIVSGSSLKSVPPCGTH